jgi:hypothetical protein
VPAEFARAASLSMGALDYPGVEVYLLGELAYKRAGIGCSKGSDETRPRVLPRYNFARLSASSSNSRYSSGPHLVLSSRLRQLARVCRRTIPLAAPPPRVQIAFGREALIALSLVRVIRDRTTRAPISLPPRDRRPSSWNGRHPGSSRPMGGSAVAPTRTDGKLRLENASREIDQRGSRPAWMLLNGGFRAITSRAMLGLLEFDCCMRTSGFVLAVILTVVVLASPSMADAQQARVHRVGVVLQGGSYSAAVDGLRDGA